MKGLILAFFVCLWGFPAPAATAPNRLRDIEISIVHRYGSSPINPFIVSIRFSSKKDFADSDLFFIHNLFDKGDRISVFYMKKSRVRLVTSCSPKELSFSESLDWFADSTPCKSFKSRQIKTPKKILFQVRETSGESYMVVCSFNQDEYQKEQLALTSRSVPVRRYDRCRLHDKNFFQKKTQVSKISADKEYVTRTDNKTHGAKNDQLQKNH